MSDLEQIAYLRLLCHQWLGGDAGLTADLATLLRLAGKVCTAAVLAKFAEGADGRLRNARLEIICQEQRDRIRKASDADLQDVLQEVQGELLSLRTQAILQAPTNPMRIRHIRKMVARIHTELGARAAKAAKA